MTERADGSAHRGACAGTAADGRFELYKTTAQHDGDEGREQHGFPIEHGRRSSRAYLGAGRCCARCVPRPAAMDEVATWRIVRGRVPRRLTPEERKSLTHGDFWIPEEERDVYRRALRSAERRRDSVRRRRRLRDLRAHRHLPPDQGPRSVLRDRRPSCRPRGRCRGRVRHTARGSTLAGESDCRASTSSI